MQIHFLDILSKTTDQNQENIGWTKVIVLGSFGNFSSPLIPPYFLRQQTRIKKNQGGRKSLFWALLATFRPS